MLESVKCSGGRVVRHGSAKPATGVQFPLRTPSYVVVTRDSNGPVCKTGIRGCERLPQLQFYSFLAQW